MSRGMARYSRNHGLKLTDRILLPVQEWQVLLTLLFNAGLTLCDLFLFPYFLKVANSWKSRCPFLLTIIIISDFLEKSILFSKIFLKIFFRRISSKFFVIKKGSREIYCLSFLLLQEIERVGNVQKSHNKIYYRNKRPCN